MFAAFTQHLVHGRLKRFVQLGEVGKLPTHLLLVFCEGGHAHQSHRQKVREFLPSIWRPQCKDFLPIESKLGGLLCDDIGGGRGCEFVGGFRARGAERVVVWVAAAAV